MREGKERVLVERGATTSPPPLFLSSYISIHA